MKKIIFALLIAFISETAFAQNNESDPTADPGNSKQTKRSSFYMNGGVGFDFTYIYYDHQYFSDKIKYNGSGLGVTGELSFGVFIKQIVAVHGSFGYVYYNGKYNLGNTKEKYRYVDDKIDDHVFLGGIGATVYPFSRTSKTFWQSAFVSGKLSLGVILMENPFSDYSDYDRLPVLQEKDHTVLGIELEIGKDWQITDRLYLGLGLKWQLLEIYSNEDRSDERLNFDDYHHNHLGNSLQFMLHINRK